MAGAKLPEMGQVCAAEGVDLKAMRELANEPVQVRLHIYNLGQHTWWLNNMLRPFGSGAFHCGVEAFGEEWGYGGLGGFVGGTGVFRCPPTMCEGHAYSETLPVGCTTVRPFEFDGLIAVMKLEWAAEEYDTLRRNCIHFAEELCGKLKVDLPPSWVRQLATAGTSIALASDLVCCRRPPAAAGSGCCGSRRDEEATEVISNRGWPSGEASQRGGTATLDMKRERIIWNAV